MTRIPVAERPVYALPCATDLEPFALIGDLPPTGVSLIPLKTETREFWTATPSPRVPPNWTRRESRANPFESPACEARKSFEESLNPTTTRTAPLLEEKTSWKGRDPCRNRVEAKSPSRRLQH